jgi:hypothetical protein
MSAARFYSMRSCNDDYVPSQPVYTFTSSTRDETDARFIQDTKLEALDAKLEANFADYERRLNGSEDDIIRKDFDYDTETIMEYAKEHNLSISDAVDYLKCCHYCGNNDIPFGNEYCNQRCQEYSVDYCYPCFRGSDCKVCSNYEKDYYEREENLVYDDSGEITPRCRVIKIDNEGVVDYDYDDDHYEEFSLSDRFNNYEDDLDNDECCEYCQMSKKLVLYNWRCEDGGLCEDCANLLTQNDEA